MGKRKQTELERTLKREFFKSIIKRIKDDHIELKKRISDDCQFAKSMLEDNRENYSQRSYIKNKLEINDLLKNVNIK
jgi:hypothetical protein